MKLIIPLISACILTLNGTEQYKQIELVEHQTNKIESSVQDKPIIKLSKEKMISDIEAVWNMWYDDQGINSTHRINKRRKNFRKYAEYLAEAIQYFQEHKTSRGGKLPSDESTHIIMAVMVAAETSVRTDVIGKSRGEVGLLQIHGHALQGYKKHKVINNPQLGLWLGTRWMAYHIQFCNPETNDITKWNKYISVYSAGLSNGRNKDGKCKEINIAKRRVRMAELYSKKINMTTNKQAF